MNKQWASLVIQMVKNPPAIGMFMVHILLKPGLENFEPGSKLFCSHVK